MNFAALSFKNYIKPRQLDVHQTVDVSSSAQIQHFDSLTCQ